MERVLYQTEQERRLKIHFCFREVKKVRSLFWRSVAGVAGEEGSFFYFIEVYLPS